MNTILIISLILLFLLIGIFVYSIQKEDTFITIVSFITMILFVIIITLVMFDNIDGDYATPKKGVIDNDSNDEYIIFDASRLQREHRIIGTDEWIKEEVIKFIP